ncbi:MAG TPA: SGNH/GDSL hydrolase family protein [Bryobacteraceae bacterium]|jgi:lysophospholipase L1-like esterase|nr:SGNH/GDSL hydrolase family protein [Bryobacteraceae bacterium]
MNAVLVCAFVGIALCAGPLGYAQAVPPQAPSSHPEQIQQESAAGNPDVQKLQTQLAHDEKALQDWPNLARYHDENGKLNPPMASERRVVFLGDSITDGWGRGQGSKFFPGQPYVNRGISGQTTPQMLIRFRPDVIALQPRAVVILAGTNDLAGNTGPETLDGIEGNLESMAELAKANGIRVVLASVMPVCDCFKLQTQQRPPAKILALNAWMKDYCARSGCVYLDYYSAMADSSGLFKRELTYDGLHPNNAGYEVMAPLAQKAVDQALSH